MSRTNSKNDNIADIVKQLDNLSIKETAQILTYVNQWVRNKQSDSNEKKPKHLDKKGNELRVGDRVILLTKGVDNRKNEEGIVKSLPDSTGGYISFVPVRFQNTQNQLTVRKLGKSVKKILEWTKCGRNEWRASANNPAARDECGNKQR